MTDDAAAARKRRQRGHQGRYQASRKVGPCPCGRAVRDHQASEWIWGCALKVRD